MKISMLFLSLAFLFIGACGRGETQQSPKQSDVLIDNIDAVPFENKMLPSTSSRDLVESYSNIPEFGDVVTFIENNAVLPNRASKLKTYHRYYSRDTQSSEFSIVAIYLHDRFGIPHHSDYIAIPNMHQAYFVHYDNLPMIMDGGCSVITIRFDLNNMKFFKTNDPFSKKTDRNLYDGICNGYA